MLQYSGRLSAIKELKPMFKKLAADALGLSDIGSVIAPVVLETAGTVDLDIEIKFIIGSVPISIDVHKKYIEELKDLYKALIKISETCRENETSMDYAQQSLNLASNTLSRAMIQEEHLVNNFKELNETAFNWLMNSRKKYNVKDFGYIFEKYINN